MYISKKDREFIKQKFGGKCAYSGTELEPDWQVEHIQPVIRNWWTNTVMFEDAHNLDNMVPVQKLINHYKGSIHLEEFRTYLLGGLHLRLKKLPKNPRTEKGAKKKAYILKIASYFGITEDTPFSGRFYFETVECSTSKGLRSANLSNYTDQISGLQRFKFAVKPLLVLHFVGSRFYLSNLKLNI